MKATLFVIPGHTKHEEETRKNLEDLWNGSTIEKELAEIDPKDETLSNWKELKIMNESGLIDIEVHTLFHREIFTDLQINDFITSETVFTPFNSPASPYLKSENIGLGFSKEDLIGLPVFQSYPLLSGKPEVKVPESVLKESKILYSEAEAHGKLDSKSKEELIKKLNLKLSFEEKEFLNPEKVIYNDLSKCRELIKENVDENSGNHLCLPWTIGSDIAIEICKKVGIKSCFWGVRNDRKINKTGDDPYFSCRIKNDFIFRLPGNGRKSLPSIYGSKIKRRLSGERVF